MADCPNNPDNQKQETALAAIGENDSADEDKEERYEAVFVGAFKNADRFFTATELLWDT